MAKIKTYPSKNPVSSDKFVGSDSENSDKTVNFTFEGVLALLNSLNENEAVSYVFSTESSGELDENGAGYFISENDIVNPEDLTKIIVSKNIISGIDLSQLFTYIGVNKDNFVLKLRNISDPNNFIYLDITSVTEEEYSFSFALSVNETGGFIGELEDTKMYSFSFEIISSTETDLVIKTENSTGAIQGFEITNNGDGTVDIEEGDAFLRASNDQYAPLFKITIPQVNNLTLTDNANNFILVDYNGGSPAITVTTNSSIINTETNSLMAVISRVGNVLDILSLVGQNNDANAKLRIRFLNQEGIRRANGAVIGFVNRNLTLTAGTLFSGLIRINSPAFNTATLDAFTYVYNNGSVWTRLTGQTQVDNLQYNNSGVLTTMSNNRFRVDYIYLLPNNPSKLYVVYGNTTYANITTARTSPTPSSLPSELQVLGLLVGRQIIEKNATSISEVSSSFSDVFSGGGVPEHNALAGLQGGAVGDYQHLTTFEKNNMVSGSGTSGRVSFWDGTNSQGGDASFVWDNTNKRLGIGVAPSVAFEVNGNSFASTQIRSLAISNTDNPVLSLRRARLGTTAVLNNDAIGGIGWRAFDGVSYGSVNAAAIDVYAAENFTSSAHGTYMAFSVTPKLSTTAVVPFKIFTESVNVDYNIANPIGVQAGFYSTILGKGDNSTYKGVASGNFRAEDRSDVTALNKGVLIGVQATVAPKVFRNNVPYDDVNGVMINNDGTARATDALYISKNATIVGDQWNTLFTSDANSNYGIRLMGTHTTEYINLANKFKVDKDGLTTIVANINPTTNNAVSLGTDTLNFANVRSNIFSSNTSLTFNTPNNNSISFSQGGVQKMILFNTGNFVIKDGGTFTDTGLYRLDVQGAGRFTGALNIPTASIGTNDNTAATTAFVNSRIITDTSATLYTQATIASTYPSVGDGQIVLCPNQAKIYVKTDGVWYSTNFSSVP